MNTKKILTTTLCISIFAACESIGGSALEAPAPDLAPANSVAPDAATVDAQPVLAIDTQPAIDTAPAIDTQAVDTAPANPCGQGYAPAVYTPTTFIWCAPNGEPIAGRACGSMIETALFGEGIYRCLPSQPDGGIGR
jgi:hypothetical protein